jgi:hypothetical protein
MYGARTRKLNHCFVSIVAALLTLVLASPAYAIGGATFNGEGATNVWGYDSVNVTAYGYDLFGAATKDLAPGDVRSIEVSLRNNAPDPVDFRLAARSLSTAEARYLEAAYPGKTADDALLDAIDLTVRHGATTLYAGTLRGASSAGMYSTSGVAIGRVSAGWAGAITVELSVPSSVDNAYMNKLCAVEWVFIAAQYNDEEPIAPPEDPSAEPGAPTTPGTSGTGGTGGTASGGTVIVIDDTPISELPGEPTPTSSGTTRGGGPEVIVEADPVPQVPGRAAAWALLNLILTVVSGLLMVALMVRFLLGRSRTYQDSRNGSTGSSAGIRRWPEGSAADTTARTETIEKHMRLKGLFGLIGVVALIASIVLFILTEDMTLPLRWVDAYTLWHLVIVCGEVVLLLLPRTKRTQSAAA